MADDLDRAQAHIEMMAAENVHMSKRAAGPDPSLHYAKCLNCGAETHGRRWCDAECRDEWAEENEK